MARIVDFEVEGEDNQNPEETVSTVDEMEAATAESPDVEQEVEAPEATDLPDKYQGKSASELAEMHSNLEKLMGKQSQEVGELRKAFDSMVQDSIVTRNVAQSAPEPEVEDIDFFTDPKAAIARAVASDPTLQHARVVTAEMAKKEALASLQTSHPDMREVLSDSKFQEWVGASKIRTQLYQSADQNYDYESANELISLWKERAQVVKQTAAVEKQAQKQEIKKAATGSSRSNPSGQTTRKTYRRRDIIELMQKDPARYEAMQPEIMKAYAEGRVK
jgi:hypothetical protein